MDKLFHRKPGGQTKARIPIAQEEKIQKDDVPPSLPNTGVSIRVTQEKTKRTFEVRLSI